MEAKKISRKVQIATDAKPLTAEIAADALFGMSLAELVRKISENRGGKYNDLYEEAKPA